MDDLERLSDIGRQAARDGGWALANCLAAAPHDDNARSAIVWAYIIENRRLQARKRKEQRSLNGRYLLTDADLDFLHETRIRVD